MHASTKHTAVFASMVAITAMSLGRPAHSQTISNGNFASGDLTGFTTFTTANGTNGPGLPNVVLFDVTGSGATHAAHFNVGKNNFSTPEGGGGISQNVFFNNSSTFTFSADIASQTVNPLPNVAGGVFSLLVDNNVVANFDFGFVTQNVIYRDTISGSTTVGAGMHQFSILIQRPYLANGSDITPDQYVTNLKITPAVPEPAAPIGISVGLIALGLLMIRSRRRQIL